MDTIYRKQKSFLIVLASIILTALVTLKGPPEVHAETRHYNDEETVTNLTSIQGNKVDMIAQWSQVSVTLPEGKIHWKSKRYLYSRKSKRNVVCEMDCH